MYNNIIHDRYIPIIKCAEFTIGNIEKVKKRYINPLVRYNNEYKRLKDISKKATNDINEALEYKTAKYVFLDFDFK